MKSLGFQSGLSSIGWILVLLVLGFSVMTFFKVGPAYLDNYFVRGSLKQVGQDIQNWDTYSKKEIKSALSRYFMINNIRGEAVESAVKIKKMNNGHYLVTIDYEKRIPFIANADVLVSFKNHLSTKTPDVCCTPQEKK